MVSCSTFFSALNAPLLLSFHHFTFDAMRCDVMNNRSNISFVFYVLKYLFLYELSSYFQFHFYFDVRNVHNSPHAFNENWGIHKFTSVHTAHTISFGTECKQTKLELWLNCSTGNGGRERKKTVVRSGRITNGKFFHKQKENEEKESRKKLLHKIKMKIIKIGKPHIVSKFPLRSIHWTNNFRTLCCFILFLLPILQHSTY